MNKRRNHPNNKYPILRIKDIMKGCSMALKNAEALIIDASILLRKKRYARAFFLGSLALEENGKYIMLCSMIVQILKKDVDWKKFWIRYRNHKAKIRNAWMLYYGLFKKNKYTKEIDKFMDYYFLNVINQDEMKMKSLYSDFSKKTFVKPADIINYKLASDKIKFAITMQRLNNLHYKLTMESNVTINELALLVKNYRCYLKHKIIYIKQFHGFDFIGFIVFVKDIDLYKIFVMINIIRRLYAWTGKMFCCLSFKSSGFS